MNPVMIHDDGMGRAVPGEAAFATVPEAHAYLFGLRRFGVKWGLGPIAAALRALGSPQRAFPSVHIAGTNGKGSTAAMTAALLTAQGLRTGLFTSPHLERFSERIRVDGVELSDADLIAALDKVRACGVPLSFFETATAMAFLHFANVGVDLAVVEVGLGGRLDATQWIRPCASAITSLGSDHCLALTGSPERVAWEKASIAAPGVPMVLPGDLTGPQLEAVLRTLAARGAVPLRCGVDWGFSVEGSRIRWNFGEEPAAVVDVPLLGEHQPANCAMALTLARLALGRPLDLTAPFSDFSWPGRMESIDGLWLDGAHNPPALEALVRTVGGLGLAPLPVIVGFMADKDVSRSLRILGAIATGFHCTVVEDSDRALPAAELADQVRQLGLPVASVTTCVADALAQAPRPSLIAGSFYLAGRARSLLMRHKASDARLSDPSC
ncbi:bifunctional folylpolyglutamate synthase/dihydrofolate synthase [Myxococcota bacterium]|nr:bifunctional folylpolyglutamate synthase/dihydrofolate synthase [Myxococcota bacterium]